MNGLTEPQKRIWRHLCSVNNSRCPAKCTLWTQGFNSFNRHTVYIVFVEDLLGSWQGSFPGINIHVLISVPPDVQTGTQTVGTSGYNCDHLKWHFSRVAIGFKLSTIAKLVNYNLHFVCKRSFLFNSRQPFGPQKIKREKVETQLIFITTYHPAVQKTRRMENWSVIENQPLLKKAFDNI